MGFLSAFALFLGTQLLLAPGLILISIACSLGFAISRRKLFKAHSVTQVIMSILVMLTFGLGVLLVLAGAEELSYHLGIR